MLRWPLVSGLLLVGLVIEFAAAQNGLPAPKAVRFAADEENLWLTRVEPRHSRLFYRDVNSAFRERPSLNAFIDELVATDGALHAVVAGGKFWTLSGDEWLVANNLPEQATPLNLVAFDNKVCALVHSPPPGALPQMESGEVSTTSQPYDAGGAPLSVVWYSSRGWQGVAPCPISIDEDAPVPLRPRLAVIHESMCLLWPTPERQGIECVRYDATAAEWVPVATAPPVINLVGFWVATVNRVPMLIIATRAADGGCELRVFRLSGTLPEQVEWRHASLHLSDLPDGVRPARYEAAFGFNQHLTLLMIDPGGEAYLRFGRTDADPAEKTVAVAAVLGHTDQAVRRYEWLRGGTLLVLLVVLMTLFLFRRGSLAQTAVLPSDCAVALVFQRLVGWAIDWFPFAIAAALMTGVPWREGFEELLAWAGVSSSAPDRFPVGTTLLWWGVATGMHTVYSLVMELLTRRTIGKALTGTRLLSDTGTIPRATQIVVRNVCRLVEMLPPLWILAFLVVVSRNRQRLGDIFAHTVVVRRIKPRPESDQS